MTTLYDFCSQSSCTDGVGPEAGLVQATNGAFYGTTYMGGADVICEHTACGTVFKITPSGALTSLFSFDDYDGAFPVAPLIQATNGELYGTTYSGGMIFNNFCYGPDGFGCGTVFEITLSGALTTLYNFCSQTNCVDGIWPAAGLTQGTDGKFYGAAGGFNTTLGTLFTIDSTGHETVLHSFCSPTNCADGQNPDGMLLQDTNGNFYGTTAAGGANNDGTVFSLSVGLGPFVKTQPKSGKVGATIKILGTNLKGSTSVTFNGVAATFTVVSNSELTTTVPAGARTGTVRVVTPTRTLSSNVPFRVTK